MKNQMLPLRGIRVLDFSKVLAGPLCTQALGDLGADVIKIESVVGGDDTRGWPPIREDAGAVFLAANRSKRSLALDLKSSQGRDIACRLARDADIVVESFGTGVTDRLGIDYETLKKHNPDLIYCSISGYGRTGPLAQAKGYDMILQAFTGIVSLMGEPGQGLVRAPFSPVDQATGMHAQSGILAALLNRNITGDGCQIDVSLFDTGVSYLGYMLQSYWERGTEPQRFGCAHESLCPYQAFDASDKQVLIGIASEPLWQQFCEVAGLEKYIGDSRFRTNTDRVRNRAETVALVSGVIAQRTSAEWIQKLTEVGIPCAQVNSLADVLAHPHTQHSGLVARYDGGPFGMLQAIVPPIRFDGQRIDPTRAPPKLGEHSAEILAELGFSAEEIRGLGAKGVVGAPKAKHAEG